MPKPTGVATTITPSRGGVIVNTEAQAATDTLATVHTSNLPDGRWLLLRSTSNARAVVVKHQAGGLGQIALMGAADVTLSTTDMWLLLERADTNWRELMRSSNVNTVICPGTSAANVVPLWNGTDGKTLKAGLPAGTGANALVQLGASPGTPDTTKFLRGDQVWATPATASAQDVCWACLPAWK